MEWELTELLVGVGGGGGGRSVGRSSWLVVKREREKPNHKLQRALPSEWIIVMAEVIAPPSVLCLSCD